MASKTLNRTIRGLVGAGAIVLVIAGQAGAAPMGFDQRAGFLQPPTFEEPGLDLQYLNPTGGAPYPANTFFDLRWRAEGSDTAFSALNIQTFTSQNSPTRFNKTQGDTNGDGFWDSSEFFTITKLTQTNHVIEIFAVPLWTIAARANLSLYADAALTSLIATDTDHDANIHFNETHNLASPAICPGVPAGHNPHNTACDDVYRVAKAELSTPVSIDLGGGVFLDITFRLLPISGVFLFDDGTNVFAYTAETDPGISELDVQMHWALRGVPAPASLALLGWGLAAVAAFRLRRTIS